MPNELDTDDETNSAVARINTAVSNSNDGRRLFDIIIILVVAEIVVGGGALSTVTSRLLA